MIKSFQLIQQKIESVLNQMSRNDPSRDELIIANAECNKRLKELNIQLKYYEDVYCDGE